MSQPIAPPEIDTNDVRPGRYLHMSGVEVRVDRVSDTTVFFHRENVPQRHAQPLDRPLADFAYPGRYTRIGD